MTSEDNEEAFIKKTECGTEDVLLETILSKFRPLGPYYGRFMPFLIFSSMTNAFYCLNYVFAAVHVDYRCKYECENGYSYLGSAFNATPKEGRCYKYSVINNGNCSVEDFNISHVVGCNEWVYEEPRSFVAEFDLGCQDWKRTLVGTVHSFGYMLGLLLLGPVSDKVGRKKMIVFTGVTGALMGLARSITVSYWVYIALELAEALLGDSYSPTFMLGVEMVTKENRVLFGPLMICSMSLSGALMALVAWLVPYWRHFLRVIYTPGLLFIFYAFFVDESVRWLLIKGRKDEAKKILRKAAKTSNVHVSEETLNGIECETGAESINLISSLKMTVTSRKLLLRFLACGCMWITSSFNKYALLINSVSLEGHKHLNYAITALSDLPASIVLVFVLMKFKRKIPLICSFLLTGIFCVVHSFIPKGYPQISTTLFLIGKFMSTISFATIYLYTSELFPTCTRNTMHALCSSIGRIGSIMALQTPLLRRFWPGLPSVIIGSLSLITGVVILLMPDTAEEVLPDTVRQAEAVGSKVDSKNERATITCLP